MHFHRLDGCADGNSGNYHSDESIDRIVVSSTSGKLVEGSLATITATGEIHMLPDAFKLCL